MAIMKISIVGRNKSLLEKEAKKYFKIDNKNPNIVIAYGGDGTFLYSEQLYPGVPKLLIKHSRTCIMCRNHDYSKVLPLLANKKYKIIESSKVEAILKGRKILGLNEINIHYNPPRALRLNVKVNNKEIAKEIISDGIVIATPYGSSAYFKSITRKTFNKGLGIAFNNPTKPIKHRLISDKSVVKVKIARGEGIISVDCNKTLIPVKTGEVITIKKSNKKAKLIQLRDKKLKYII